MNVDRIDHFVVKRLGEPDLTVVLDRPMMRIGRADACDVRLDDPERGVSRFHALLQKNSDREEFRIRNDEGKAGTLVNNQRIHDWHVLKRGDVVGIGTFQLVYEYGGTPVEDHSATNLVPPSSETGVDFENAQTVLESTLELSRDKLAATAPGGRVQLVFTEGPFAGGQQIIEQSEFSIGRDRKNLVWLSDPSISLVHVEVYRLDNRYIVKDAKSHNGVFLNGKKIHGATSIKNGQTLRMGKSAFRFVDLEASRGVRWGRVLVVFLLILSVLLLMRYGLNRAE